MRLGNKGQGLLESVLVLPLAISFVVLLLALSYRAAVYYFIDYSLHEALICTDDSPVKSCEHDLQKRIQKILIAGEDLQVRLTQSGKIVRGTARIQKPLPLLIEKQMKFPLKVARTWF
jgi:hypothetical protein